MEKSDYLTTRVTPEFGKDFRDLCKALGMNYADAIRQAIEEWYHDQLIRLKRKTDYKREYVDKELERRAFMAE